MKIQHHILAVLAVIVVAAMLTLATATPAYALSKGDPTYDIIVMALTVYIIVSPLVIVALIVLLVRASKKAKNAQRDAVILPSAQRAQMAIQASPYDDPYADVASSFQPAAHPQQAPARQQHAVHSSTHGRISEPAQPRQRPQQQQQQQFQQQAHSSTAQQHAKMKQAQAQRQAQARVAQQQVQQGQARPKIHIDPNGAQGRRRQQ